MIFKKKKISRWFNSGDFSTAFWRLQSAWKTDRQYPYVKGGNSGASQMLSWEQLVTCLAHSNEHFNTSLAEYWCGGGEGGGCTVGQVTSLTIASETVPIIVLRSYPNVALETVPMFVWLTTALSRPFKKIVCRALPLSTPLSSRRSLAWFTLRGCGVCYVKPVLNRLSSEIQGTALGKCLRAWTCVYRFMPAGVAQSRHAFVGGTVSTWARWRMPVNKRQKRHQKCRSSAHCSWETGRSDSRFAQLVV